MRIEISGDEATGKTTMALYICEALQLAGIIATRVNGYDRHTLKEIGYIITLADPTPEQLAKLRHMARPHPMEGRDK